MSYISRSTRELRGNDRVKGRGQRHGAETWGRNQGQKQGAKTWGRDQGQKQGAKTRGRDRGQKPGRHLLSSLSPAIAQYIPVPNQVP